MTKISINLNTVRAGRNKIPGIISELDQESSFRSSQMFLREIAKIGDSLLLKIDTIKDAQKVLRAALKIELYLMQELKQNDWIVYKMLSPMFYENPEDLSENEIKELKRNVLLFCYRRELDARRFLKKAAVPVNEHFNFKTQIYNPPARDKGRYLAVSMPCPLSLNFHTRPQGDVWFYGNLFKDYPIYLVREALDTGKHMALEISKDEYDGILNTIHTGQKMVFYSVKTDQMAHMVLKGLLNLIRAAESYECDTCGIDKRSLDKGFRFY